MSLKQALLLRFAREHPNTAGAILGQQPEDQIAAVLALMPEDVGADVLGRAPSLVAAGALARLDPKKGTALLARLPLERAADLLRRVDPDVRDRLLGPLPEAERLRALIAYPRGTVGAVMDPSVLALSVALDLDEARRRLGRFSSSVALDVYLVDEDHRYAGVVDLREILDPARQGKLGPLGRSLDPLRDRGDMASLSSHPGWLRHDTLPVVDDRGTYLGAVRAERLRQISHEELNRRSRGGAEAVFALGEIFWLGLSGLFSSLARPQAEESR